MNRARSNRRRCTVLIEHLGDRPNVDPAAYVAPTAVLCGALTVGPRCTVDDNVFLATGSTVFNGAFIGARAEVRINGVVHLHTHLEPDTTVPIGWVAAEAGEEE